RGELRCELLTVLQQRPSAAVVEQRSEQEHVEEVREKGRGSSDVLVSNLLGTIAAQCEESLDPEMFGPSPVGPDEMGTVPRVEIRGTHDVRELGHLTQPVPRDHAEHLEQRCLLDRVVEAMTSRPLLDALIIELEQ